MPPTRKGGFGWGVEGWGWENVAFPSDGITRVSSLAALDDAHVLSRATFLSLAQAPRVGENELQLSRCSDYFAAMGPQEHLLEASNTTVYASGTGSLSAGALLTRCTHGCISSPADLVWIFVARSSNMLSLDSFREALITVSKDHSVDHTGCPLQCCPSLAEGCSDAVMPTANGSWGSESLTETHGWKSARTPPMLCW